MRQLQLCRLHAASTFSSSRASAAQQHSAIAPICQAGRQCLTQAWRPGPCPWQVTGNAILAELQRQRETIQRAQQQTQQTGANVAQADSLLKKMSSWWRL